MVSTRSLCRTASRSSSQSYTYSKRCAVVIVCVLLSSRTQLFLWRASATIHCFLLDNFYKFGAMSLGRRPWSHPDCQNFAFFPSPRVIIAQAAKRNRSETSHGGRNQPTPSLERHIHAIANEAAEPSKSSPGLGVQDLQFSWGGKSVSS